MTEHTTTGPRPTDGATAAEDTTIRPFRIDVPEEELVELRRRIQATRWPEQETVADASNTGVSSGRLYWENTLGFFDVKGVTVPAAVSVFPNELYQAPRTWTEQAYPNLIYFNQVDQGNHFAACNSRSCSPPRCEPHSNPCVDRRPRQQRRSS
jgi:Epoxide hydrolase N terminus